MIKRHDILGSQQALLFPCIKHAYDSYNGQDCPFVNGNRVAGGEILDSSLTDKLLEVLNKESDIYEGILKLSKEKTDAIVAGKISELESITRLEQSIILKLGKLERERESVVEKLAAGLKVKATEITLTNLINMLPEARQKNLKLQDGFIEILDKLSEANMLNSKLIQNSLDYIDFSINILAGTGAEGNYSSLGGTGEVLKNNFFDMKL